MLGNFLTFDRSMVGMGTEPSARDLGALTFGSSALLFPGFRVAAEGQNVRFDSDAQARLDLFFFSFEKLLGTSNLSLALIKFL